MSGSQDKSISLWNPVKGLHLKTYTGPHNHEVNDIAIHSDNNCFASVGGDRLVFLWDVQSGKVLRKFQGHTQAVNCVAFNPQYNVLLSGSLDATVRIWDLAGSERRGAQRIQARDIQVLEEQKDSVSQIIATEDQILVACLDGFLRVYDIRMGMVTSDDMGGISRIHDIVVAPIIAMDISEDGNYVVCSCLDSKIRLFERETGDIIATYEKEHVVKDYKASVKFAKDNKHLLTTSESHLIAVYGIASVRA
ncbi:MAG: hypothetical protein P4M11_10065 [Candidatus Pacebacteria bacterium]|nr:hypothetical protein [Candidatus Paceibacterota bacterium]